ncbi:MAG TPA: hypothetical protein VIV14_07985 [Gammaproteobacteria bacterium]
MTAWWCLVHAVALAGVAGVFVDIGTVAACGTAVLGHALWFRPPRPPKFIGYAEGHWFLPGAGGRLLVVAHGARLGPWWVRLVLAAPSHETTILLLRDQLAASEWRLLRRALQCGH